MTGTLRVGLLGAGRIGAAHAETLHRHPAVERLLVADADPGRARHTAQALGAASTTSTASPPDKPDTPSTTRATDTAKTAAAATVDEVFAAGVDALVIATPTATHADLILRAVEAGLPAFCEKPVAIDVKRTVEVVEAVTRSGVAVQVGFQRRFDAGFLAARAALRSGAIGVLHRLHLVTADPAPPHPGYIPTSGGLFRDCHIHDFDIARWLTGVEVIEVYATGANRGARFFAEAGDVDTAAAILTLADGTLATVQGSRYNGGGYDVRAELAGTRGTHVVGLSDRAPLRSAEPGVAWPAGPAWPDFWPRFQPAYAAELDAFLDLAAGRAANRCPATEALQALYVAEAADLSRREHRPVRLDEVRS